MKSIIVLLNAAIILFSTTLVALEFTPCVRQNF